MLEPHPFGVGSVSRTLDELKAAGVKAQYTSPDFALTHEKGMIIDSSTAYIMTSNFSRSALGGYSSGTKNREYGIIDSNPQDVQAVMAIFIADWNHTPAQFNDANLVVSPVNSRSAFMNIIGNAQHSLLIESEEMNDSAIEQALVSAASRGVQIEIILPAPGGSSGDSNRQGIAAIKQSNIIVREDPQLYVHAKIIVEDASKAFVGSENISTQSLDQNRELGILVSDATVLSKLQRTFQTDWGVSHNV
jgi:phosphatidylserine/phosphatidylglycerophosphate/cardiolipin synthase-like enzyme